MYSRRSFAARYKGMLIRSTLEYLLIKAYEALGIQYIYEPLYLQTLSGKRYKPDFYLPDTNEYIEVKPRKYVQETEKFSGLNIRIVFEDEIYNLVEKAGLSRAELSKEWRNNAEIGPYGSITFKDVICACGNSFKVTTTSNRVRKYCSNSCSAMQEHRKINSLKGAQQEKDNQQTIYNAIKQGIDTFVENNIDLVLQAQYNKLGRLPIWNTLYKSTGTKDMRIYSKAVFGIDMGRKELLRYMKNMAENICRTNENKESLELKDKKPLG